MNYEDLYYEEERRRKESEKEYDELRRTMGNEISRLQRVIREYREEADIRMKSRKKDKRNLAEATAVVAYWAGHSRTKLGDEGMIMNYDLIVQVAEAFCEKYPAGFDWEEFYDNGGHCWDVTCEAFAQQYIKDNDIWTDPND